MASRDGMGVGGTVRTSTTHRSTAMKRLAIAALLALLGTEAAKADVINFSGFAFGNESSIAFNITTGGGTEAGYAGELQSTLNGKSFLTYCVDLLQSFDWNTSYNDYSLLSPGTKQLPWFTSAKANDLGRLFTGYGAKVTDYVTSAAFQLDIWAIITETAPNYSVKGNGFTATPYFSGTTATEILAINTAESWLQSLPGYSNYSVKVEYSPAEQDMIVANKVPEPAPLALLMGGVALLAAGRRRLPV